tara:strand:+ start:1027 stop:1230 length:204 start_codon:yes stop_codon:yes gene_type:complete
MINIFHLSLLLIFKLDLFLSLFFNLINNEKIINAINTIPTNNLRYWFKIKSIMSIIINIAKLVELKM